MTDALEAGAARWRAEGRRRLAAEGALKGGGAAACALAAALWADHLLSLPAPLRQVLWGAGAGAAVVALYRGLLLPWRALDLRAALRAAAERHPSARPYLVSAWELERAGARPGTSSELARAHVERARDVVVGLAGAPAFETRPSRRAARLGAAGAAALLSLAALGAGPAWERVLAPWRVLPLERFVSVAPGDAALERGRPASVEASWSADSPVAAARDQLRLETRGGAGWRAAPWDRLEARAASFTTPGLSEPLVYRLAWRDLRTRAYTLTPILAPRLESLRARVHGPRPEHAALTAAEPLTVVRGAWVVVSGTPNQPLAKALLKLSTQPGPIALKLAESGELEAGFTASENAAFQFELETADGRVDPEPAVYRLTAKADEPPRVELISPAEPVQASPHDLLPLAFSARDDGGLARLSLVVRAKGRPQQELTVAQAEGARDVVSEYAWDLSGLPRGRVEFQLKAYDTGAPGQSGLSRVGVVDLVDFDGAHEKMEKDWMAAQERLKALAEKEEAAARLAGRQDAAGLEAAQAGLAADWRAAADRFDDLAKQLAEDAYANPGIAEQARPLAEDLQRAAGRDSAEAAQAGRSGDFAKAERLHERLAQRARLAQRTLEEGRKIQGLQDFYTHSSRMNHASAALKSAVEAAANAGKATPEEKARLEAALGKVQRQIEDLMKVLASLPKVDPQSPEARGRQQLAIPVDGAKRAADQLAQALASGDLAAAARAAQRLSEQLEAIQRGIGEAAAEAASSSPARQANAKAEKVEALWSEAVEEQTRSLEAVQRVEDERLEKRAASDKALLELLAREQQALAEDAARAPGAPPEAVREMGEAAGELSGGKARKAPELMKSASTRLRYPAPVSPERDSLAARQDLIRARLEAPREPPPAPKEQAQAAGALQRQAREKTQALSRELSSLENEMPLPPELGRSIDAASAKQRQAEGQLAAGDTTGAAASQREALQLLSEGSQGMQGSSGAQRSAAQGMSEPFSRPAAGARPGGSGGRAARGASLGLVPLPSSREYKPPRELREELEKSLQESRPAAHDGLIKEYFKRISQ